ncbi:MAG: SpoIIE family protein phosphatase, partial [Vicinamibacterales bacterium]
HTQYMSQFPTLSVAVVPWGEGATRIAATDDGYWVRDGAPRAVPEWISVGGFEGVLMTSDPQDDGHALMTARGVDVVNEGGRTFAVIADIAVDEAVLEQVKEATGVDCHLSSLHFSSSEAGRSPMAPSLLDGGDSARRRRSWRPSREWLRWPWNTSVAFVEWSTGRSGDASVEVTIDLLDVYNRVTASRHDSPGFSVRDVVPLGIAIVALLFLIVQSVALVMGVTLARSITGSIHELFDGTERVMQGDFSHRIRMTAQDQLGELAQSFNRMTASVESLLLQAAEKKRLEEELRIAREIQMSLLPSGPLDAPGISITALCVPAREVGGDYYDFFHLDSDRVGVLIADVAGKGTSAALYMAELKGLMLSLSQLHESPRRLLTEVNRIISAHLDGRSFITMTYAIVDTAAGTFTYARAGHTPLIHVTGGSDARVATAHAPEGLVLGIRIDGLSERFESMLEERTIPLQRDDVFVFYTDGVTEAMNPAMDLFGEERLCALIEAHGDLPTDELRERVVREIETFVGAADQHDDLTMILLKVERVLVAPTLAASAMPV